MSEIDTIKKLKLELESKIKDLEKRFQELQTPNVNIEIDDELSLTSKNPIRNDILTSNLSDVIKSIDISDKGKSISISGKTMMDKSITRNLDKSTLAVGDIELGNNYPVSGDAAFRYIEKFPHNTLSEGAGITIDKTYNYITDKNKYVINNNFPGKNIVFNGFEYICRDSKSTFQGNIEYIIIDPDFLESELTISSDTLEFPDIIIEPKKNIKICIDKNTYELYKGILYMVNNEECKKVLSSSENIISINSNILDRLESIENRLTNLENKLYEWTANTNESLKK